MFFDPDKNQWGSMVLDNLFIPWKITEDPCDIYGWLE
jgi:hypothetical protein